MTLHNTDIPFSINPPVPVAGSYNFRDLGGLPFKTGGAVATGVLYRSDGLHNIDDAGRAVMTQLGITRIVDLRHQRELMDMPSAIDHQVMEIVHRPILEEASIGSQSTSVQNIGLSHIYDTILDERGAALVEAFHSIAEATGAVVFHCTAGKDRTGVLAALVLETVGVIRPAVIADYVASQDNLAGEWAEAILSSREVTRMKSAGIEDLVTIATQTPAPVMAGLLDRLDEQYGGAQQYLRDHGLDDMALEQLRQKLIGDLS